MQNYEILPHPSIPDARVLRFDDGSVQTVPASILSLSANGALAQNMSVPVPEENRSVSDAGPAPLPAGLGFVPNATPAPTQEPAPSPQASVAAPASAPVGPTVQRNPISSLLLTEGARQLLRGQYVPGRQGNVDAKGNPYPRLEVPQMRATAVQGQEAYDPEAIARFQRSQLEAAQVGEDAKVQKAQNDLEIARQQHQELQRYTDQQASMQRAREEDFNSRYATLTAEAKSAAAGEVNPKRVFDNTSTWGKIGLVIAAALSGAANPGGPNQTLQLIERLSADDIRAQEDKLRATRGTAENALIRLSQQWGSIEAGRTALALQQKEAMASFVALRAAEIGTPVALANRDAFLKMFAANQEQQRYELWQRSQGVLGTETRSSMEIPRHDTPGGYTTDSKSYINQLKTLLEAGKIDEEAYAKALANSGLGAKTATDRRIDYNQRRDLGKDLGALSDYGRAIDSVISASGAVVGKDGKVTFPNGAPRGLGGVVQLLAKTFGEDVAQLATDETGRVNRARLQTVLASRIHELSGAAFSAKEAASHAMQIGDGLFDSPEVLVHKLLVLQKDIRSKEKHIQAAADPDVLRQYWDNYRQLEQKANQNTQYVRRPYAPASTEENVAEDMGALQ